MKKHMLWWVILPVLFLCACNLTQSQTKTVEPTTPPPQPTTAVATPVLSKPSTTSTAPAQPPVPVIYYYFVAIAGNTYPAGSVVILPDILVLAPELSNIARGSDPAINIGSALQAMLRDARNAWSSSDVGITSIAFSAGSAKVVLRGKFFGAGDVVLIAARMQMLMTVFAEAAVQTATITLNGENIANLGISHGSEAKPANYAYTRAEIETCMAENAYK